METTLSFYYHIGLDSCVLGLVDWILGFDDCEFSDAIFFQNKIIHYAYCVRPMRIFIHLEMNSYQYLTNFTTFMQVEFFVEICVLKTDIIWVTNDCKELNEGYKI